MSEDPFGRRGEERTDPFGRPVARGEESVEAAPPAPPAAPAPPGGFAPPTDAPPERAAWWAEAPARPLQTAPPGPAGAPFPGEPAEWVQRAGAAVVDFLVRLALYAAIVLVSAISVLAGDEVGGVGTTIGVVVGIVAWLAYAPFMIATRDGQTVGHRATGTRVVRSDGSPLTGGGAFAREVLVKALLFESVIGTFSLGIGTLVNYLWPLWDDRNEALHDKVASTRVLKA